MTKQRIVVVMGGGSGMGRAIAHAFAKAGDTVVVLGRSLDKLQETAQGHEAIEPIAADITDTKAVDQAIGTIVKQHDHIDVLVNCAGGNMKAPDGLKLPEANKLWKQIIDVNLTGTFNMIFAALPHITRPGGRIINITSVAAFAGSGAPGVNGQAYASAKSGVHGLTRTLSNVLAPQGITINCVAPGVIDETDFFGPDGIAPERKAVNESKIPMGRLGKPEEIAPGVLYLASDEAAFISGEILNINGGVQFGR